MTTKEVAPLRQARRTFTASLSEKFPGFKKRHIDEVETNLLNLLSDGLREGRDVALVKEEGESLDVQVIQLIHKPIKALDKSRLKMRGAEEER